MQYWADIVTSEVEGSSLAVTPDGVPYVLLPVHHNETVELFFKVDTNELPFSIWFRRYDNGCVAEERLYAQAGTRRLAILLLKEVRDLRVNSFPPVLVEDGE